MNWELLYGWGQRNARRLIGVGVGVLLIGLGAGVMKWDASQSGGVKILSESSEVAESEDGNSLVVDVAGAVVAPGVYKLPLGSRIEDALGAAGGLAASADTNWIEMYLNRSMKVEDGMKIYVPRQGKQDKVPGEVGGISSGKVNLNEASSKELEELPGIGPVTAGKIVDGRPYGKTEELVERKIVGEKVWEQIKEKVAVW